MSYDPLPSSNPYRPYVVPLEPSSPVVSNSNRSARELLADLDLPTDYLENPEFGDFISDLLSKGISKYVSIFIRQPFEIVKTTMQVQYLPRPRLEAKQTRPLHRRPLASEEDFDEVLVCFGYANC
jgi:hypothetical protein